MRRLTMMMLGLCVSCCMLAQKRMTVEQVQDGWQTKTISCTGGANIIQLVQAFQKIWPTHAGEALLALAEDPPTDNDANLFNVIDIQNGYVGYMDNDPDSDEAETMSACIWKRSNGHKLFAVFLLDAQARRSSTLCFYDLDPRTGMLIPDTGLADLFVPTDPYEGRFVVHLPWHGKEFVVMEYPGGIEIVHRYIWDGMNPVFQTTAINNVNSMEAMYWQGFIGSNGASMTHYALVDVDGDGISELWLRSENFDYQAVYSIWPTVRLVGGQDDRQFLSFYRGVVCHSGHCGAGCSSATYSFLKDSSLDFSLSEILEWDYAKDDYGAALYMKNGSDISADEGERLVKSLGQELKFTPKWRKFSSYQ